MLNCKNVYVLYGYKTSQNESFSKEKTKLKTLNKQIYKVLAYNESKHIRVNILWVKYFQTRITFGYSKLSDTLV